MQALTSGKHLRKKGCIQNMSRIDQLEQESGRYESVKRAIVDKEKEL